MVIDHPNLYFGVKTGNMGSQVGTKFEIRSEDSVNSGRVVERKTRRHLSVDPERTLLVSRGDPLLLKTLPSRLCIKSSPSTIPLPLLLFFTVTDYSFFIRKRRKRIRKLTVTVPFVIVNDYVHLIGPRDGGNSRVVDLHLHPLSTPETRYPVT